MDIPIFGSIPNSQLKCWNNLGQQVNCSEVQGETAAAGTYYVTDLENKYIATRIIVGDGLSQWGFHLGGGTVVFRDINDSPYLKYIRGLLYIMIGYFAFRTIRNFF